MYLVLLHIEKFPGMSGSWVRGWADSNYFVDIYGILCGEHSEGEIYSFNDLEACVKIMKSVVSTTIQNRCFSLEDMFSLNLFPYVFLLQFPSLCNEYKVPIS